MTRIRAAVVTVSDTRKPDNDISGTTLADLLRDMGAEVVQSQIISDDLDGLKALLVRLADQGNIDLLLTTGGTGFGPRDNAPEATRAVIDRDAPGLAEAIRRETATKTPLSMLSRAVSGIRGSTLIINLPGSPKAVAECFEVIRPVLGHAVELLSGKKPH